MYAVTKYEPPANKIMRMHSVTSVIENGVVHLPETATWLAEYLHELSSFPNGKYDDQADSTSQALDWFKQGSMFVEHGLIAYWRQEYEKMLAGTPSRAGSPSDEPNPMREIWNRARWREFF